MKTLWKWIDALARAVIRLIGRIFPRLGALCEKLWDNTELVSYLFVGVATTVVNYVVYYLATRVAGLAVMPGTWTAWAVAVAFGYGANKAFVFHTHCAGLAALLREAGSFFAMRLVSLGMETVLMYGLVEVLHLNDLAMKLLVNIVVILLNYVFSKLVIFKKQEK
ncbi:MAG TPA: GtrA family protein [Candidatus Ventricola intestinavium]|nr:GtrA family protein [Candidatus Ventricola intestinavium]